MGRLKEMLMKFKDNPFWRSVATLTTGTVLAQGIGLLTTPVVSRLYSPSAFGQYALIFSVASIIVSIVSLGLSSAVMVPEEDEESKDVFMVAAFTSFVLATVIFLGIVFLSPFVRFFNPDSNYLLASALIYVLVLITTFKGLLDIYANRKRKNQVLFYNSLIGALATLFITIPLGFYKAGSMGLIIAAIASTVISILQMLYHVNPLKKLPSLSGFKRVFRRNKDFILYQYPSNFINDFALQLPTQVLSSTYGNTNLGAYSMNEKVLGIPLRVIGFPINTVYFRTASEYHREGKDLASFTYSLITKLMLLGFLPMLLLVFWGKEIFTFVLGPEWGQAGQLSSVLVLLYVFMLVTNCISYSRVAIGRQGTNLMVSIFRLIITALTFVIGVFVFENLFATIVVYTIGTVLYYIIDTAVTFYCMKKYYIRFSIFASVYMLITVGLWFLLGVI